MESISNLRGAVRQASLERLFLLVQWNLGWFLLGSLPCYCAWFRIYISGGCSKSSWRGKWKSPVLLENIAFVIFCFRTIFLLRGYSITSFFFLVLLWMHTPKNSTNTAVSQCKLTESVLACDTICWSRLTSYYQLECVRVASHDTASLGTTQHPLAQHSIPWHMARGDS